MKIFLLFLIWILGFNFCEEAASRPPENSSEREIRAALCKLENENYTGALNDLEKILQKEPENIYARRLLPGALALQIKNGDRSPENTARIKKVIEAFEQFAKMAQSPAAEKAAAENFVIMLYEKLGAEEKARALLRKVEDKDQPPPVRSKFYATLAAQSYACAGEILGQAKKPAKAALEKAAGCVSKGLEYVDQAIALDADNDTAWSYKASLLLFAVKFPEAAANEPARKASLQKDADAARKRYVELSDKKRTEFAGQPEAKQKTPDAADFSGELTVYKFEKTLDELVREIYIPVEMSIIAPVPFSADPDDKKSGAALPKSDDRQKPRAWKVFAPADDEFAAELPDNVESDFSEGALVYQAGSEGVEFMIISQPKPAAQTSAGDDAVLNSLAWAVVVPTRNLSLLGSSPAGFEVNLIRKEDLAGQPARIYAYAVNSCAGKKDGTILTLIGKKRNYAIRIHGANEPDARTQRFIKSLKFTARND